MKFLISKWVEKMIKGGLLAVVTWLTGPRIVPILQPIADAFGWTLDPTALQAGLWVLLLSLSNWLKHQPWSPTLVRRLL